MLQAVSCKGKNTGKDKGLIRARKRMRVRERIRVRQFVRIRVRIRRGKSDLRVTVREMTDQK